MQPDLFGQDTPPAPRGARAAPPTCAYCTAPATRFCDYVLGPAIDSYVRVPPIEQNLFSPLIDVARPPHTCDMPMCTTHATQIGFVHIKARAPIGGMETIDHCEEHVGQDDRLASPITDDEAASMRRAMRAAVARRLIRLWAK